MKKILILANNSGGLYLFRKELLAKLIEQGNTLYISLPRGSYIEALREIGCIFVDTPIDRRGTNLVTDSKLIIRYYRLLKDIKPDVVLTYTMKPDTYGCLVCRLMNIPYIANITGMGSALNNEGIIKRLVVSLLKISLKRASCVFFQNDMNRKYFLKEKIVSTGNRLIPGSGVNLAMHCLEDYPGDENVTFLFIGRVMKEKGIGEFLAAAETIRARYPFTEFEIAGSCEEEYEEVLKQLQERKIIIYLGHQNNIHGCIKSCHAVILPSYHEGMSNVLLEAASSGRPVIATNIPGCRETFDEGISGFGFEARNTPALINAIDKFIQLPHEDKKQMGLAGRAKVEREFDRQIVIDSYLEEINNVIKS